MWREASAEGFRAGRSGYEALLITYREAFDALCARMSQRVADYGLRAARADAPWALSLRQPAK